ncbi:MAG: dephospho-CoA kinase [Prevotella sp.]|jgi:dephospho-CoA kinase|nr:dephospho-CoA kinase [Prevotella sp.]
MKFGITGGIGSGKSFVCKRLQLRGIDVYDCDAAAKRLINTDADIRRKLTALIGPEAYMSVPNGSIVGTTPTVLNKAAVARFLLDSESNAKAIDDIVHPAVFRDFQESGIEWMESAIMYESGIYRLVDRVIVVTAPLEVRIQRVMKRDGITREKVLEWMQRQWPQDEVRRRADYEIINDGQADIDAQIDHLFNIILSSL